MCPHKYVHIGRDTGKLSMPINKYTNANNKNISGSFGLSGQRDERKEPKRPDKRDRLFCM